MLHVKTRHTIHPTTRYPFLLVRRVMFTNGLEGLVHQHWNICEWVICQEPLQLICRPLLLVVLDNDVDIVPHRLLNIEHFTSNGNSLQIVAPFCDGNRGVLYVVSGKSNGKKTYEEFEEVPICDCGYSCWKNPRRIQSYVSAPALTGATASTSTSRTTGTTVRDIPDGQSTDRSHFRNLPSKLSHPSLILSTAK